MVKRDLIGNILLIGLILIGFILLRLFVFSTYQVNSKDSNQYFHANDLLLVNARKTPKYKDFVVYEADEKLHMGRVIGTSGDQVTYMDDIFYLNNQVESQAYIESLKSDYIKNPVLDNPYTSDFTLEIISGKHNLQEIPKDQFLILNDNRQNVEDSRLFGLISKKQIRGIVRLKLLPLKDFGFVEVE